MEYSREEDSCERESNVRCPSQKSKKLPKKPKDLAYKSILRPKLEYASSVYEALIKEGLLQIFICAQIYCTMVQWNNINAPDDHAQFKSMLSLIDLRIGGDTYKY